jgi:undecaprenyl pyrophosphate phosphatase UppP
MAPSLRPVGRRAADPTHPGCSCISPTRIHAQVAAGFLTAGLAAYLSARFLTRYFTTRTLTPFAAYRLMAGGISIAWFAG